MDTISSKSNVNKSNIPTFGEDVEVELPTNEHPLIIRAKSNLNSIEWGRKYKNQLNDCLTIYGAILIRGFNIGNAEGFNDLFSTVSGDPIKYENRTSPREQVYNNVYTSTNHPKHQQIHMHTENSYSLVYNRIIAFFCLVPPLEGGETPIADERKLLNSLKQETLEKFNQKKIQYLRNSSPGIGLDWRTIYQTDDKKVVNQYLESNEFEYSWVDSDHLRVKWTLSAFQKHPLTNQNLWFNHMYFGLKCHYNPLVLEYFNEENLPFATYYGDGSEIEESVIQEFRDFYSQNSIVFKWEKNDFLMLDNMMFSHGRNPFKGERKILTAMSQPVDFH
ncbi:TauD/TfdA family dioxygenase [Maribacter sp. 2307UL18-2]|uniref:TauD/TfdA family dioxygenase n=1 Tax=Maribacter sp. 2307UL18-2 TaxID=3386274 RepID=UPI0039BCBE47